MDCGISSYHVHNGPPVVPVPGQINLVHAFQSHFFDIYLNIILSSPYQAHSSFPDSAQEHSKSSDVPHF